MPQTYGEKVALGKYRDHAVKDYRFHRSLRDAGIVDIRRAEERRMGNTITMMLCVAGVCLGLYAIVVMLFVM